MPVNPGQTDDPEVATVICQLNIYLRQHPNAADTSEGIARWWFDAPLRPTIGQVNAALRSMQALGIVEALHAADGRVRYRLQCAMGAGGANDTSQSCGGTPFKGAH
jgi:hypothetical protein